MKIDYIFENIVALLFIMFVITFYKRMTRNEFIAFLFVPLCATLAIFATGIEHAILVVGYISLLAANALYDEIYEILKKYVWLICLLFLVATLAIMMYLKDQTVYLLCSAAIALFILASSVAPAQFRDR